ncbi:LysR family transcriptional regulator [Halomonas sp. M4R1S46]|uniref:LysR family transcriptional regulator n=1 Tax=Halomonas sp. M4R1S46 TaxID=2982692 RepID=UPI0021E464E6|nr:LysR family transcriptional regulator [Halomonas sp. M4R1S46]UYG07434.1 LysR family transcriptional regulator [Halomonas sp. M4R1S46]
MRWSLDQLEVLVACAERGSFSSAARHLGRAQSAVSTAIAHLEADLGCQLFDRTGRLPRLTEAGKALLHEARAVIRQCQRLESRARAIAQGEEAQLVLAIDEALVEMPPVDETLEALARHYPALQLTLLYGAQGDIAGWVEDRTADLGILLRQQSQGPVLEGIRIAHLQQVLVVGRDHPLAGLPALTAGDLADHRQLLIASRSEGDAGATLSAQFWRLNSFYSMGELATRGLGWALVPQHIAQYPPFREDLVELSGEALGRPPVIEVETVSRRDAAQGPIARWLRQTLGERFRDRRRR